MLCSLLTVGEGSKHMGGVCPDAGGPSPESHCVNMDQHRTSRGSCRLNGLKWHWLEQTQQKNLGHKYDAQKNWTEQILISNITQINWRQGWQLNVCPASQTELLKLSQDDLTGRHHNIRPVSHCRLGLVVTSVREKWRNTGFTSGNPPSTHGSVYVLIRMVSRGRHRHVYSGLTLVRLKGFQMSLL